MGDGFRSRVATNVVPLAQPNPASFRSGIAEGLTQVGSAMEHVADLEYKRATGEEVTRLAAKLNDARAEFERRQAEAQSAPPDDIAGFGDKAAGDWKPVADAIIGEAGSADAQDALKRQAASASYSIRADGLRFEFQTRSQRQGDDLKRSTAAFENRSLDLGADKEDQFQAEMAALAAYGEALKVSYGPDIAGRWVRDTTGAMVLRRAQGAITRGEHGFARALIDGDQAKALWDPDNRAALMRQLETGEAQAQVAAARAEQEAAAQLKGGANALMLEHDAGGAVDPEALRREAVRVAASDPARAFRFHRAASAAEEVAVYGNDRATPGQLTERLAQIEDVKDWRGNPDLVARHSAIEKLRGEQRRALPNYAPLNLADPAAVRQRVAEMETWGQTHNGQRYVFGKDQADELATLARGGASGRAQVAEALSRLPGRSAMVGLWQVAPKDSTMRAAINLPARLRNEVFRGEELRKANPKLTPQSDMNERWGERGQRALDALPTEYQAAMKESATALYAARSNGGDFDERLWDQVLNEVIDPSGSGGVGEHNGHPTLLPDGMTQRELDERWAAWPDSRGVRDGAGRIIGGATIRQNYHLVPTLTDGRYRLADQKGRLALGNHQRPYEINIRDLVAAPRPAVTTQRTPTSAVWVAPPQRDTGVRGPVWVAPPRKVP